MKNSLINKTELKRIVHQNNKRVSKDFYKKFEKFTKESLIDFVKNSDTKTVYGIQPSLF